MSKNNKGFTDRCTYNFSVLSVYHAFPPLKSASNTHDSFSRSILGLFATSALALHPLLGHALPTAPTHAMLR